MEEKVGKRKLLPLLATLTLLTPLAVGINANSDLIITQDGEVSNFVPGRVLVKFKSLPEEELALKVLSVLPGAELLKKFSSVPGLALIKLPDGVGVEEAIAKLESLEEVIYAEPDYIVKAVEEPNDPYYPEQWGLEKIRAPEAWDYTTGSQELVVAVIDTGIDYTHEDLKENMWTNPGEIPGNGVDDDGNGYVDDYYGINTVDDSSNAGCGSSSQSGEDPMDDEGHGTHVAGIIGAVGNNQTGVSGVNWEVKLMACKFLDSRGFGTTSGAIECLDYVKAMKDRGVNVIATNNSWGGDDDSEALKEAIESQQEAGIIFVAAAGNDGDDNDQNPEYPTSFSVDNIISVAATDQEDALAYFSNYGQQSVDVGAPGVDILSTYLSNDYETLSGTSMATPFVTGLVALSKAFNPELPWYQVRNLILTGGEPLESLEGKCLTGRRVSAPGSLANNNPLFGVIDPIDGKTFQQGEEVVLKAVNITGALPAGEVKVRIEPDGIELTLQDLGEGADQVAGDGIYAASITFDSPGDRSITFESSQGEKTVEISVE